jgi:GT2 family glycosyltransferase
MVTVAESEPSVGIVAPKILYYSDRKRIWYLGDRRHRWLPIPLSIGRGAIDKGQWTGPQSVDYVSGCCMLVKRSIFRKIGLFDSQYFMYYEDADFCRRVREAGFKILCVPEAKMWHKVSLSAMKDRPRTRYLKARNRILFYRKYAHGPHPWLTAFWLGLSVLKMTVIDAWRGDRELIACQWRGFLDGYREALTEG